MAPPNKRDSNNGSSGNGNGKPRKTQSSHNEGRAKAASIFLREERKSDKRQVLADALTANLRAKYAKNDPEFGDSIESMTQRLVLHTQRRIVESDIVALEAVVRKMSQERVAKRGPIAGKHTSGSAGAGGASAGPGVQQINEAGHSPTKNGRGGSGGGDLKGQDEWVLLNALTLVEYESDKDSAKSRLAEKQRLQREWLDAQKAEKERQKTQERQVQHKHYEHQVDDLGKWQNEESMKKQRQQEQVLLVRAERDEQLRQQKLRHDQQLAMKKREEESDLQRVQRELQKADEDAMVRRQVEHERVKRLQEETAKDQHIKTRVKIQEQEADVQLMEAYAQRLAREEDARMNHLQTKLKRRDKISNGIASSLQEQQHKKLQEDERRAEEYQRKKDEVAIQKEQQTAEMRRREAQERKQFLELQRHQKKEREHKYVEDDLDYAQYVHSDSRAAMEEQKKRAQQVRQRNVKEQERLLEQMKQQKEGKPFSPLHLPRTLMNSREKNINAKQLQKVQEPEIATQVLSKLSPSKEQKEYAISTSFY